jgi:hypothetical protein
MVQPNKPSPSVVAEFHANCDADGSQTAQHHTLGIKNGQASPGDHVHDGKSSKRIGSGINLSFPSVAAGAYSAPQIQAIIDALRALGFGT